mmetsp:Transcript_19050/g.34465  ORF Transcript_19050/g.34465 Transcript_19050/m.34465 type:complete len:344 (+) Transcript_19050:92-1123(+)
MQKRLRGSDPQLAVEVDLRCSQILETLPSCQWQDSPEFRWCMRIGIPARYRWHVWQKLLKVKSGTGQAELVLQQDEWTQQIEMDVGRTLASEPSFTDRKREQLQSLLKAYARATPSIGYCQGMNFIGGIIVLVCDDLLESLTAFKAVMEGPCQLAGFFASGFPKLCQYVSACDLLLQEEAPALRDHFLEECILPATYLHQWFLTLFAGTLPLPVVFGIWDRIIYEGLPFLLKQAVAMLLLLQQQLLKMNLEETMEYFRKLKSPPQQTLQYLGPMLIAQADKVVVPEHILQLLHTGALDEDFEGNPLSKRSGESVGDPEDTAMSQGLGESIDGSESSDASFHIE